ncbi:ANTAR domain-containing response regulator [Ruminococcus flavefaciens]|jgi:response regulator NasT|uniref:Stage 0 sporulation protein A homolog n=2 Tax=Ruminococcus TaxID=1263 RepID=A0A315Y1C5_RUMFL|nr:ANTAR domain-containing protein [Ruminococcus flavefaciens]MBQ6170436.1 ANTAR domain-containing protein [Ruminococcus sp.]PWJ14095.1 response regulator receiver and ANTAR domain protein [Ruminococcus flavefaciens]SSA43770.1 response regulator receiver and ANTAR domain protein [Ruminococcus flavefaciens]
MERALIVSANNEVSELAEQLLRIEGCGRIASAVSGSEARRLVKNDTEPELVIINTPLSDEFGQELAEMIADNTSAGIILICGSDVSDEIADRVSDSGINVLARPVTRELLQRTIRLVIAARVRMAGVKKESSDILSRIEEMRTINRAKTTLMKYLKFTEPQAHKYIEKQAMNNRQTRLEVAVRILAQYE